MKDFIKGLFFGWILSFIIVVVSIYLYDKSSKRVIIKEEIIVKDTIKPDKSKKRTGWVIESKHQGYYMGAGNYYFTISNPETGEIQKDYKVGKFTYNKYNIGDTIK